MKLKNKKHIIFDWDGTLADTLQMWNNADALLLKSVGKEPKENAGMERDKFLHNNNNGDVFIKYNQYLIDTYNIIGISAVELNKLRGEVIKEASKNIDLKPQAEEFLIYARCLGYTLTLATLTTKKQLDFYASENQNVKSKTDEFKIFNGTVLTGDDVKNKKPNPEVYFRALEKTGFSAQDSIVIEDSLTGVTASKNAGIYTISIYDSHNDFDRELIEKLVDEQVQNYSELIKKLV